MIKILYFSSYREMLDCENEEIELPEDSMTISKLMQLLAERGDQWQVIFAGQLPVLAAINQEIVNADAIINNHDEIGFFPPVSGG
ncbi:MAG: molybdopterin converting factor subunit 1 [Gammaproteobacteria bacterium]|jgi:sulfur-carrier protein